MTTRSLPTLAAAATAAVASLGVLASLGATPARAQRADTLRAPGLHGPVEIVRDSNGIAHIRARDEHDLFFAQGWNAARDRLFQLELWRRQATGTMAEALGPRWAARDRAARLFAYRGDMRRELAHYHPRGAAIVQAFVDGVNARVAQVARDSSLLPPELRRLGITPGRWTPAVVVSRHNALAGNAEQELDLARAVRVMGAEGVRAVGKFEPDPVVLSRATRAVDVAALSDSVLAPYRAWRAPLAFVAGELTTASAPAPAPNDPDDRQLDGSNNWVVSGARTATGKPLLANDPHRTIQVPSLRYWVHLKRAGWDVVGAGEPALPGVSVGHNAHGAWGLTIFGIDVEDVYVYRTDPGRSCRATATRGAWERCASCATRCACAAPRRPPVALRFTRTRTGALGGHRAAPRLRAPRGVARAGHGALPREPAPRPGAHVGGVPGRRGTAPHAGGEPDLGGHGGHDRLAGGGHRAGAPRVERAASPCPGDGRYEWARLPPGRPAAARRRTRPPASSRRRTRTTSPRATRDVDAVARGSWADPWRVTRIREVLGTTPKRDGGRHGRAAARRALASRARARAAAARGGAGRCRGALGARRAARLGLPALGGERAGGGVRRVGAALLSAQVARRGRSRGGASVPALGQPAPAWSSG